jgi:hypothetical protein
MELFGENSDVDVVVPDPAPAVSVCGRDFRPSPVFDTYWRFAARRQVIYEARREGAPRPWTDDPILRQHRFTNCYRARPTGSVST